MGAANDEVAVLRARLHDAEAALARRDEDIARLEAALGRRSKAWRCHCPPPPGAPEHFHEYAESCDGPWLISPECPGARSGEAPPGGLSDDSVIEWALSWVREEDRARFGEGLRRELNARRSEAAKTCRCVYTGEDVERCAACQAIVDEKMRGLATAEAIPALFREGWNAVFDAMHKRAPGSVEEAWARRESAQQQTNDDTKPNGDNRNGNNDSGNVRVQHDRENQHRGSERRAEVRGDGDLQSGVGTGEQAVVGVHAQREVGDVHHEPRGAGGVPAGKELPPDVRGGADRVGTTAAGSVRSAARNASQQTSEVGASHKTSDSRSGSPSGYGPGEGPAFEGAAALTRRNEALPRGDAETPRYPYEAGRVLANPPTFDAPPLAGPNASPALRFAIGQEVLVSGRCPSILRGFKAKVVAYGPLDDDTWTVETPLYSEEIGGTWLTATTSAAGPSSRKALVNMSAADAWAFADEIRRETIEACARTIERGGAGNGAYRRKDHAAEIRALAGQFTRPASGGKP